MELALSMTLKFYTSVTKGLKLKIRKFLRIIPTFVKVTAEKRSKKSPKRPLSILNSVKDFFSKFDQICRKLRICSHLLKKSLMENLFAVRCSIKKMETMSDIADYFVQFWPTLFYETNNSMYFYCAKDTLTSSFLVLFFPCLE